MNALLEQPQLVLESTHHNLVAEPDEVKQDLPQIKLGWFAAVRVVIR